MRVLVLSACLVLGFAMWWLARSTGDAPANGEPRKPAVSSSADSDGPAPRSVASRPRVTAPPAEPAPPARPESDREAAVAGQQAHLQARFAEQQLDPAWAGTARQTLSDDLGKLSGKDVRLQNIECRSSLCRAELAVTSREAGDAFMQSWIRQRSWPGPGFVAGEDQKLIVYLGRPGADLPFME